MEQLIDFHAPEVQAVLDTLLKDKSTGKNIIWATDPPEELQTVMYEPVTDKSQITTQQLGLTHYEVVLPRMMKQTDTQQQRTRKKGEVFSPAWVCNKMNNALDADWFRGLGAEESAGQFTVELPQGWQTVETPVQFPVCGGRTPAWVQYVQSRRLEVTCGEAPFLASRYDAATGEMIPVARRIGILDRKLRVVSENAATEDEWRKYATHAVQSTYGYEYQGDNLLLARVNLLLTYAEHLQARWQRKPTKEELQPIANIISWNLWQMDGLHLSVPGGKPQPETEQLDLFSMFGAAEPQPPTVSCKVKNWRKGSHGTTQNFETIQEGSTSMKFDYVIGNPPYQISDGGAGVSATPIYNRFIEAIKTTHPGAICLIIPAKWYSGGKGLDKFREEMLGDRHISTLVDYSNSLDVFPNVDVAGGVCYFVWKEAYNGKCKYTNYRNGEYHTGMYTVSAHVPMGENVGASCDGRLAKTPLADGGLSAVYGRDLKGPTAVLKSVSHLDNSCTTNGGLLNMKFLPEFFKTESGIDKFANFMRTFVDLEIPHIQFNVVRKEDLLNAKIHPDQYRSLTVRVAGYTAYFTELAGELQDEIIARTSYDNI